MKPNLRLLGMGVVTVWALVSGRAEPGVVGPEGYSTGFSALPAGGEWTTYAYPGAPANVYDLTNLVQGLAASTISSNLFDGSPADPPTQRLLGFWTSGGGGYVGTRPTGDRCTLLMVSLVNQSGSNATRVRVEYDLGVKLPQTEPDYPGLRAFYSLGGASNSWVGIGELSIAPPVAGRLTAEVSLGAPWIHGNRLYVVWVDDNANIAQAEPAYTLDNFFVGVTAGEPIPTSLACLVDRPGNNTAVLSGVPITTGATVFQGTPPYTVEYYTNAGVGNLEYVSAGSSGVAPYGVNVGALSAGTYNIYGVVRDSTEPVASTNSTTNTFLVADPLVVTLTAPLSGSTFDYLTSVEGAAVVSGGTGPYGVQFYLDNVAHGAAVTAEPYTHSFGLLTAGTHTMRAGVRDAMGWVGSSLVATVSVTGPLAVTLTPTNGTTYNYGQSVTLTGAVIYGKAPYAVSFYTNEVLAGVVTNAPFVTNLGVLAVGSYTGRVHVVDGRVPTGEEADSRTNVITIVENPLGVSLSGVTNGQKVGQGSDLTAVASVGAPVTVARVEFFLDGVSLGVDSTAPYAVSVGNTSLGAHGVWAVATDSLGRSNTSETIAVTVVMPTGALVGPGGYTNSFATQPVASEWASFSRAGGGGDNYNMDSDVNANLRASGATNRTVADAANPPAANANAVWSSTGFYLQTRPTGNRYTVLLGKFTNESGTNATEIGLSYLFTIAAGAGSEDAGLGTRVYYSLTGQTSSWVNLGTLGTTASTNGSSTLNTNLVLIWTNGASLFLAWVDDNASGTGPGATDPAQQIANFSLRVRAGLPPMFTCLVQAPTNGAVYVSGTPVTATAQVIYGVEPYVVEYYISSGAADPVFQFAGLGLTAPDYAVDLGSFVAGTYRMYGMAYDSAGVMSLTNSMTNTFMVADPIRVTLSAPAQDATFDYLSSVEGVATVSGGIPPYAVQFYLDGMAHGAPVSAAPYAHDFGPLFVGDHLIQARVTDATGWVSESAVHTVHITGPVGVLLSPTNGSAFNYGQPLVLNAQAGGGTGPYVVSIYVNDQLVGTRSAPPFLVDLGLVPVGSYTCWAQVTDSSVPAQQAISDTNLITILENPLVATLISPTNGQSAATNVGFVLTASVAVAAPVTVSGVEFFLDGTSVGVDDSAPYSMRVTTLTLGTHLVHAVATDSLGRQSMTATNTVTAVHDPLANNDFVNRIILSGPQVTVSGSNVGATTEPGEPTTSGGFNTWGATLWWLWTAPANGTVVINTTGSSFNTSLGVYTGTAVNGLSQVAFSGSVFGQPLTQVSFTAQQGTQYQIQVGGMMRFGPGGGSPATGAYQLNLQMPASVAITSPTNGSVFIAGTNYEITATASSPNGAVTKVDFYVGGLLVGTDTTEPYSVIVSNAVAGTNRLVAVVTDSAGVTAQSTTVNVAVFNWGLTLVSPLDGTIYASTNPITAGAYAMLPAGTMTNVEFYVNGVKFGEDATAPFSVGWSNVVGGSHRLTAIGKDDTGKSYNSQPVNIAVAQTLLARGSVWKYLDNGSDQGTAWRMPGFDDSSWTNGPAELGYGDGDEATVVNGGPAGNYFITTYFRSTFVAHNLASYSTILMNVKRDDGAVVYLNGVEAARFNMPSGDINYLTTTDNASDDGANFNAATVPTSLLVEGTNRIAVEIHQTNPTSSDVSFNMDLSGVPFVIRNAFPTITLTSPAGGTLALAPASLTLSAEASDSDGTVTKVEFFANDTKLGEATQAPYTLTLVDVPAGVYVLTATATDDQAGTQTSAPATVTVYNPSSRWVAINDHVAGPGTHPNATTWNAFGTDGGAPGDEGPLRNVATGGLLTANLTILEFGGFADTTCGAPLPGTPAYETFNGLVDFGSGDLNHAILVNGDSLVMHLFTGLDPLRRYSFRGTVVGGVANYSNRWTLVTIVGAEAFTAAHTANVLTSATQPALAPDEAAMNTGDNRSGDVVGWDAIAPSADGSFLILSSQYLGPAPGNARPGPLAYAPVAVRLEEIGALPLVQITSPPDGTVVEGPTNVAITAFAKGIDGISQVQFLGDGVGLGSATSAPYGVVWNDVPFGSHVLTAVACDADGICSTSAPVGMTVTIPPTNTVAPTIASQTPAGYSTITNLTSIQVTFSERVVGVDAADLLLNDVPALSVSGSGSNYTFTVAQPPYGGIYVRWAENHGITDVGWPERLPFDRNDPSAVWEYTLIDRTPPVVAAKIPPANSTLTNLTAITVTFSEPVAGVSAGDLLVNNTPAYEVVGSGSNYTFAFAQPASGTVGITWAANHGITDLGATRNSFIATGNGATWNYTLDAKTVIVQSNSLWMFVKGTNEASTPTNVWRLLGFDDSGWSNAPAPFFFGDPYSNGVPAYTHLTDMRSNYTGIYLRKTFVLGNAAAITNLFLRAQIDDGMIVWINGVEVLRTNVAAGEIPYTGTASTASQDQNGAPYLNYPLLDPRGYLVPGTNVIAVHALNESIAQSSDFGFNAQLFTYQADTEVAPPRLVKKDPPPGYELELTNITVTFSEPVTNVDAADLLINGVPASGLASSTNTTYTFSFPQPPYGLVTIAWAETHGIVDLDLEPKSFDRTAASATWEYTLLNPSSPYLLAVVPEQDTTVANSLTEIAVLFSEAVTGVDAGDLLINGTPATSLSGADDLYTFSFPQPPYGVVTVTWATNHGISDLAQPPNAFEPEWPGHTWTYLLVDQIPPAVASQDPPANATVLNLTQLTVTFTEPVSGVNAGDLLINGKAASGMTSSNGACTFTFPQPNASVIHVTWTAVHGIRDLATTPNAFDATAPGATWSYATVDNVPPSLASVIPAPFSTVRSLEHVTLTFDEPVAGLTVGSLTINGGAAREVTGFGAGPYQFTFDQPATGAVEVAVSAALFDLAVPPNQYAGSNWTLVLNPNLPPATLTRGPYLQLPTSSSMIVRWRTSTNTDSCVWFGLDPDSCTNSVADAALTTEHIVTVTNLEPATQYYYAVGTTDGGKIASTNFFFTTDPPIGVSRPTRIWALTDFGTRDNNERIMRDTYLNFAATNGAADVWLTCGDNDQTDGSQANYTVSVFGGTYGYSNVMQYLPLRPAPGNHDYANASSTGPFYYANFDMPMNGEAGGVPSGSENYYSYDVANIHFISLDAITGTYSRTTNSEMIQWLHRDLASNTQRWAIAYWHGPPYTRGTHDSDSTTDTLSWMTQMRENVVPVLEAYGVDLVLGGHCHLPERTWLLNGHYGYSSTFSETNKVDAGDGRIDGDGAYLKPVGQKTGTVYVVVPSGGQPRTSSSAQHPATLLRLQSVLGTCIIDVDGNRLDFQTLGAYSPYTDFQVLDHFTILKDPQVAPPAAPLDVVAVQNGTQVQLSWRNVPTNELGFTVERSLDGLNYVALATVGANQTSYTDTSLPPDAPTWFYRVIAWNDQGPSGSSDVATVGEDVAPWIVHQPQNVTAPAGSSVTFTVSAAGSASPIYQWYFNESTLIPEATNRTLTLPSVQSSDAGYYTVLVTNQVGWVLSTEAYLTVTGSLAIRLRIEQAGETITVSWPATPDDWDLESCAALDTAGGWQTVSEGIVSDGTTKRHSTTTVPGEGMRFYRLKRR